MENPAKHAMLFVSIAVAAAWVALWVGAGPSELVAGQPDVFVVTDGTAWLGLEPWTFDELGLDATDTGGQHIAAHGEELELAVDPTSTWRMAMGKSSRQAAVGGTLRTEGALLLAGAGSRTALGNLIIELGPGGRGTITNTLDGPLSGEAVFRVSSATMTVSSEERAIRVVADVSMTAVCADQLGLAGAEGVVLGMLTVEARFGPPAGSLPLEKSARPTRTVDRERDGAATATIAATEPAPDAAPLEDPDGTLVDGSDVIIGDLQSVLRYGRVGDITAYSVGTNACNMGNRRANWIASTNQHPLIFYAMFRLMDGRYEQIGVSWVKHGFYAVSQTFCWPGAGSVCDDPTDGSQLGVECSDPYSHYLNGVQSNMSLRSDANAHTGYFPYPWEAPDWDDLTDKRMQVHDADLDPDLNPGALYFIEGHYIHPDDCAAGTQDNNASYRRVAVFEQSPNIFQVSPTSVTQREQPAIRAWQDTDSSVVETDAKVPGEGLFILAVKVTDLLNGFWHYEYAIENLNSDRSAGTFTVPLPRGAVVQNVGFHDIDYHSGEIYDPTDWTHTVDAARLTWSTVPYDVNPNANALRFGTLYNYRFDANVGPGQTIVTIGLFKPGMPDEVAVRTTGPSLDFLDCNNNAIADLCDITCGDECDPPCGMSADCNGNDTPDECEPDCNVNGIADECDIRDGRSIDCNDNTVPDECEPDCDGDGIPDECDTFEDTDGDGIYDCFDDCPLTTPVGACVCPERGRCCWPTGLCLEDYPRVSCLELLGTPDCTETPCRDGCLIGDPDIDGDRDLEDIARQQRCYSGPFGSADYLTPRPECTLNFDFDDDDDIDLTDYRAFRDEFAGPR
jgi:hypothetical protein